MYNIVHIWVALVTQTTGMLIIEGEEEEEEYKWLQHHGKFTELITDE